MDSDSTILLIVLIFSVLGLITLDASDFVLRSVRRTNTSADQPVGRIRESAVRKLKNANSLYSDLTTLLRITAFAILSTSLLALTILSFDMAWFWLVLILLSPWVFSLLYRPLLARIIASCPQNVIGTLAFLQVVVLWPFWPLTKLTRATQRAYDAASTVNSNGPLSLTENQNDGPTVEEQITEEPLDPLERVLIQAVLRLEDKAIREIMVPRVDVDAVNSESSLEMATEQVLASGHSRVPVYQESMDNVVGMLYARDLLKAVTTGESEIEDIQSIVRTCYFVPESKRIDELLGEFQSRRVHIAVVIDEYGGVSGIVTLNDVLEEIVGDIQDEFDSTEPTIEQGENGEFIVDARIPIDEFNTAFKSLIAGEGFDTLGGFLFSQLGKIPMSGDSVTVDGLRLQVVSTIGRRIKKVGIYKDSA